MSIKTTSTIDVEVDTTEVITSSPNDLVTSNEHTLHVRNLDSIISGTKKEYSIVGDGFYASVGTDQAPEWLTSIIDSVVEDSVRSGFVNYNELVGDVRAAIDSIDIAENTYVKTINFNALADARIGTAVETLNATIDDVAATIVSIDTVQATASSAVSSSISDIRAEFEGNDARITGIEIAYAAADEILTNSITSLSGRLDSQDGTLSGNADAIEGLKTYVGLSENNDPNNTGMLARVQVLENQNDGVIEYTTGTYDVMTGVSPGDSNLDDDELDVTREPYATWIATDTTNGDEVERSAHVGDVYIQYDATTGNYVKSYKFIKTAQDTTSPFATDAQGYTWALVTDTDSQSAYVAALNAADLADQKRRVFVNTATITTPFAPYDKGDLWVDSTTSPSVVKVATEPRANTYAAGDWVVADEQAQYFIDNTYSPDSATIHRQLDGKIEYRFYDTYADVKTPQDVAAINEADALDIIDNAWTTQDLKDYANGNIVYFKDTTNAYWYQASTPAWLAVSDTSMYQALQDAATAQGAADGKVSQFYAWGGESAPADYDIVITPEVLDENDNVVQAEVTKTVSADNFLYWYKTDGILYYKPSTEWVAVPSSAGTGNTYVSEGDIVTVFDPADGDISNYSYNGTAWQATGPTGIISQSSYFLDLDTAVRGPNGVAQGLVDLRIDSEAYTNTAVTGVTNKFEYDSVIYLNGAYYKSGFGMTTVGVIQNETSTADGLTPEAAFDSEFHVNAERFVLKSPSYPELEAVFQVTSTGIQLGLNHTEATRNEPKGSYAALVEYTKGDIVTFNNSSYVARVTVTGVTPGSDDTKWQLLAAQGVSPVVYEFDGDDSWPTSTNEAGADEHVFDSLFAGNVVVRVLAYDAEGGVNISLNGGTAVPFTRTLGDNTEEWYQFSFDNLIVGSNTLRFWATNGDGGSIKKVAVSFAGASGLNGGSVDFLFIRSASEPTLPPTNTNWQTDVTQVAAGAGDLWSVKEITPLGGGTVTYEGLRVIDAPIVREITIYSTPTTTAPTAPSSSTYDFTADPSTNDPLTINDGNWTRSVAGITTNGHKIYVSTALVTGNPTETDKAITWSAPSIYAQRQDGEDADALTVTPSYNAETGVTTLSFSDGSTASVSDGTNADSLTVTAETTNGVTTLSFSDGTQATINDGTDGTSSGVKVIYADDSDGTDATFTNNGQGYVNYYEWTGSAPTEVPAGLTYTKIVGEDGDSEGVKPIYAEDADGTNATFTFNDQEFVNFYEWTGTAPTTVPGDLTYVRFKGQERGVKVIYADDANGSAASFTDSSKLYVNYYEWVGIEPTEIPTGLTYVKFIGEDGDSEGVIPVYADDADGTNATLTFNSQGFVNFYEWTGSAPTTAPAELTYVKFVGEDGVSFTGTTEYYAKSSNGTTAPVIGITDPWFTTPPTLDATNKYLWNYNVVSRTDGSSNSTPTILTTYVKDGKGISSIAEKYQSSNSGTVVPDGTWLETIPELNNTNRYLWNQTTIEYTEGDDTVIETLIAARGADGVSTDGTDGKSTALLTVYKRSATAITAAPAGGSFNFGTLAITAPSTWSSTIPTGTDPVYASSGVASVTGTTGIDSTIAWGIPAKILENGTDGDDGVGTDGKSLFEGLIFKRSSTAITAAPTGGSFNFGTNVLTPPTGWGIDIPTGTDPVYTSSGLFEITGSTGTDNTVAWSVPRKTFADGEDGVGVDGNSVYQFAIFRRSATAITTAPTGGSYNFTSNTATAPTDWSTTFPASDGNPLYQSTTIATISGATGTDNSLTWSTPSVLVQDGTDGDTGPRGTATLTHNASDLGTAGPGDAGTIAKIAGYWDTAAPAAYADEIAGDTLIVNNTNTTAGWTHIYEYSGSAWEATNTFTVNGNQIINGTLAAEAIGSGSFRSTALTGTTPIVANDYTGTIMDSTGISVYNNGQLRVKLGDLSSV